MFGSLLGVFAMLAFLFLACQLLIGLYAMSVVQATAADAARSASRIGATQTVGADQASIEAEISRIEQRARDTLGPMGETATFEWSIDAERITLEVAADPPAFVPASLSSDEWKAITRRAVVRRERLIEVTPAVGAVPNPEAPQ